MSLACVPLAGSWDVDDLEARHPAVARVDQQRLGDATPYFIPVVEQGEGWLDLLLCRWPSGARVPVWLPTGATSTETEALRAVVAAWNDVRLGVELVSMEAGSSEGDSVVEGIEIVFAAPDPDGPPTTALTAADCQLSDPPRLVHGEIELQRDNLDVIGRPVPLDLAGFAGAAAHELAHALGFQGHVRSGRSILVREVERVRRIGADILAGGTLSAPSVQALYAAPTGVQVGRVPLSGGSARLLVRLANHAASAGWDGPYVRVGDRSARVFWTDPSGKDAALVVIDWKRVLAGAEAVFVANRRASEVLTSSR